MIGGTGKGSQCCSDDWHALGMHFRDDLLVSLDQAGLDALLAGGIWSRIADIVYAFEEHHVAGGRSVRTLDGDERAPWSLNDLIGYKLTQVRL